MTPGLNNSIVKYLSQQEQLDLLVLNNLFDIVESFLNDSFLQKQLQNQTSFLKFALRFDNSSLHQFLENLKRKSSKSQNCTLRLSLHNSFDITAETITLNQGTFYYLVRLKRQNLRSDVFEKLTFLENTLQIGVWRYNPNSKQFFGSQTTNQLLNLDETTPADMRLELVHFSTRSLIKLKTRLETCSELKYFSENLEILANGQSSWINFSGYLQAPDNNPPFILGTVQNCTAQIYMEEQNRLAIESSGIGLWLLDLNQDSLIWNKQMYDIYGLSETTNVHCYQDWQSRVHEDDIADAEKAFESAMTSHQDFQQVFRIVTPENKIRFVKARARTIYNDRNEPIKVVGANVDITDLKNEEQRTQHEREKRFSIERLASIGELAAGIGHEINNLLTIILGQLELMALDADRKSPPPEKELERLNSVKEAGFRIRDIVAGLKSMSRDEQGDIEVDVCANDLLRATEKFTQKLYHHLNITILFHIPNNDLYVSGHFGELQQVLLNLIQNAKHTTHAREHSTISISAQAMDNKRLELTVEDNGEGIPQQIQDNIFDSFYTTKPTNIGTGLGLSIVKRIIEQHQGSIAVHSKPGKGSKFRIILPLCNPKNAPDRQNSENKTKKTEKDINIVLIDDEPDLLEICTMYLSTVSERITCFHSAEDALENLTTIENMVFITDYTLPGMLGPEFIIALNDKFQTKVTCMLMTGGILSADASGSPEDLFTSIVTKPFTMADFNRQVSDLVHIYKEEI